jgi:hypothetical protein
VTIRIVAPTNRLARRNRRNLSKLPDRVGLTATASENLYRCAARVSSPTSANADDPAASAMRRHLQVSEVVYFGTAFKSARA